MNIGSLNFAVDANTAGLQRAIARLKEFEKATNKVAESGKKGSSATANAMARQEQAIRRAFQQLLNYQQAVNKTNLSEKERANQMLATNEAFQLLVRQMTSGTLKLKDFNRAVDSMAGSLGRAKRELKDTAKSADGGVTGLAKWKVLLRDLESSAVLAVGPLSGIGSRIRSIGAIMGRSHAGIKMWQLALVGGAIAATIAFAKIAGSAIAAGSQIKSLQLRFEAATGSFGMGNKRLFETIELAKKLGLEVNTLTTSYSRFLAASQGTSLEGAKSVKLFTQVARAAAALKLEATQVEGIMRALEQMMSKGTIQAEELRGQLGDRLPGAFRIMAEALGVTTRELNKMLKAGEVIASEALPKFGDQLEAALGKNAEKNVTTLSGAVSNLKTNWFEFSAGVDRGLGLSTAAVWATNALTSMVNAISFGEEAARQSALAFDDAAQAVDKYRIAVDGTRIKVGEGEELTQRYAKLVTEVNKATEELYSYGAALDFINETNSQVDPQFLLDYFTALEKLNPMPLQDLEEAARKLSMVTGLDIAPSLQGIASGMAHIASDTRDANEAMDVLLNGPAKLKELTKEFDDLVANIAHFKQGAEAFRIWEEVTVPAQEYGDALREAGEEARVATLKQNMMSVALRVWIDLQRDRKAAEQRTKDEAKQFDRMTKALISAVREVYNYQQALNALNQGPGAVRVFEEVTKHVDKMRQSMLDAGVEIPIVNTVLMGLETVLRGIMGVNIADEMAEVVKTLTDVQNNVAAMREGKDAFEIWSKVTKPAQDYGAKVFEIAQNTDAAMEAQMAMNAALLEQLELTRAQAEADKARKDEERRVRRMAKGLQDAVFQIGQLQEKLAAMARGPDSLEMFEKVSAPLAKMRQDLIELGWPLAVINVYLRQYSELLKEQFSMTDKWARANQRMADSITNGLENVLLAGESVTNMLHELSKELLRVAVRALFLDDLRNSIFQFFQTGGGPSMIAPSGGGGGGFTSPGSTPAGRGFARGGSFKLTGSGGSDKIPFFGVGKAGETVSVARPDQMGTKGGGGVTINQTNIFENIADPSFIIPLLDESNRKLKGELIDSIDRGTL